MRMTSGGAGANSPDAAAVAPSARISAATTGHRGTRWKALPPRVGLAMLGRCSRRAGTPGAVSVDFDEGATSAARCLPLFGSSASSEVLPQNLTPVSTTRRGDGGGGQRVSVSEGSTAFSRSEPNPPARQSTEGEAVSFLVVLSRKEKARPEVGTCNGGLGGRWDQPPRGDQERDAGHQMHGRQEYTRRGALRGRQGSAW
jgi:hypothetical protein